MDRRTLLQLGAASGIALTAGGAMSATTHPIDPDEAAAAVQRLRDAWPSAGNGIFADAGQLGDTLVRAERSARDRGDLTYADRLASTYADLAQHTSLAYLKAGEDGEQGAAYVWGERAQAAAERAGDVDMAALGACRRSVVVKHDRDRAMSILVRVRTARLDPWALVMVELHTATAYATGRGELADRDARAAFDRAHDALEATVGYSPRPPWGHSLHHGWLDSYHEGKALVKLDPALAERRLADAWSVTDHDDRINRGAIAVRRAEAAAALEELDDAAALALLAWTELGMVEARRDMARVRALSVRLRERSESGVVKELAEAVA